VSDSLRLHILSGIILGDKGGGHLVRDGKKLHGLGGSLGRFDILYPSASHFCAASARPDKVAAVAPDAVAPHEVPVATPAKMVS
jgi:hypothetical protein